MDQMVAVAVAALISGISVGLRRRAHRLDHLALQYSRDATRPENNLVNASLTGQDADAMIERVHWSDAVANQYRFAAARPWLLVDPSPPRVTCQCSDHANRRAKSAGR